MKLISARVTNFKSIDDSGLVSFDDVTCLVGKNESGKTAFLQSLQKLSPIDDVSGNLDLLDYPRRKFREYKRTHKAQPAIAVKAEYELQDD